MELFKQPPRTLAGCARVAILCTLPVLLAIPMSRADTADTPVHTYTIRYSPDSLLSVEGREELRRRIVRAARLVCDELSGPKDLREQMRYNTCIREATDRALAQVQADNQTRSEVQAQRQ